MKRDTIILSESKLREIVSESIKKVLSEMDLSTAAFPDTMLKYTNGKIDNGEDSGQDMNGKTIDEFERNEKARKLRNQTLTHYLLQEIGSIQFVFRIYDDKVGTNVAASFAVSSVVAFNDNIISYGGRLRKSSNNKIEDVPATIEYEFKSGSFFHNTYVNRNKRRVKLLFPNGGHNAEENNRLIQAILACLNIYRIESEKLYSEIQQYGSTKEYFALLQQRLENQKMADFAQNIRTDSNGRNHPSLGNSYGSDEVIKQAKK